MTSVLACTAAADDTNGSSGLTTYRSTVSEVRVTFFATDESNHPLASLTKSDFAVVDNERVVRNFRSFTHSNETSLDVVALVDLSESVAPRLRAAMSDMLQLVAQEQSIPNDNISVLSFGGTLGGTVGGASSSFRPAVLCTSGCRAPDSMSKLLAMKSGGTTPLFDALIFAADFISQHRHAGGRGDARPVLILFSDGYDTISLHSAREALQAVLDEGALIYSVDMGKPENQSSNEPWGNQASGSMFLRRVSDATGGRYFFFSLGSSRPDGAASVLNAVIEDLRASYVVTYDLPSHQPGFHSLRLLPTHNLKLTFHSRTGYDYEPSGH
ncbi:MAG: VWA domain-containing protein [Terriglobales bacterium]